MRPTTTDAIIAVPNPYKWKAGITPATSRIMAPLMTNKKIPRLSNVIGRVRTTIMGRTNALTIPSRSADKIIVPTSSKLIRDSMVSASHRPSEVMSILETNPRMLSLTPIFIKTFHSETSTVACKIHGDRGCEYARRHRMIEEPRLRSEQPSHNLLT